MQQEQSKLFNKGHKMFSKVWIKKNVKELMDDMVQVGLYSYPLSWEQAWFCWCCSASGVEHFSKCAEVTPRVTFITFQMGEEGEIVEPVFFIFYLSDRMKPSPKKPILSHETHNPFYWESD